MDNNKNTQNAKNTQAPQANGQKPSGELTFDDKVIQKIIGIALEEVDGLLTVDGGFFSNMKDKIVNSDNVTKGIGVEVGKEQVAVDLDIVAEYDKDIQKIYDQIVKVITEQVKKMTGLDVVEVNVKVVDIKSAEQHEKDSESVQDKATNAASTAGEYASNAAGKAKDVASNVASTVSDKAGDAKDAVVDKAGDAKDAVADKASDAKDAVQNQKESRVN